MASDNKEGSEDSSFLHVKGAGSQVKIRTPNDRTAAKQTETSESKPIEVMIKNLKEKIQTLKKKLNQQSLDFQTEKTSLLRDHKREREKQMRENKKLKSKAQTTVSEMHMKEAVYIEEIEHLKAEIESLEITERELRGEIKMLEDTKNRSDYEKQLREMSASKAEIKELKKQIKLLENDAVEREKQITKTKKENDKISTGFDRMAEQMAKQNEKFDTAIATLESNIMKKLEEKDRNTKDMLHDLIGPKFGGTEKRSTSVSNSHGQRHKALPPINDQGPSSSSRLKPEHHRCMNSGK